MIRRLLSTATLDRAARLVRFGMVGASGVVVNQGLLMLLHGRLDWPLLGSSIVAVEAAILNNFLLSSVWIWRYDYQRSRRRMLQKLAQYQAATLFTSMVVNTGTLTGLVYVFSVDYRIANLAGIAAGMSLNFLAGEYWVFRKPPAAGGADQGPDRTRPPERRGRG